jgi:hypothetical protein
MGNFQGEVLVHENNVVTLIAQPEDAETAALALCRATRSVLQTLREDCPEQNGCGARNTDPTKEVIDQLGLVVMSLGFACETCHRLRPADTLPPNCSSE